MAKIRIAGQTGSVSAAVLDKKAGLDEHAAGAAGGIEDGAVVGLDDVDDGLHERGQCEELAVVLSALHGEQPIIVACGPENLILH